MGIGGYRTVLSNREVRRALTLGLLFRVPLWAALIVMTLHVVTDLHRSYTAAGMIGALETIAMGISSPLRGRLLDRRGLRRTVGPSLIVLTVCWAIAPWVGYWPLLGLVTIAGFFNVPSFTIVRQQLLAATEAEHRKPALSLDSVATEVSYMAGPPLGVVVAAFMDLRWCLMLFALLSVAAAFVLWLADPPMVKEGELEDEDERERQGADGEADSADRAAAGGQADGAGSGGRAANVRPASGVRAWLTPAIGSLLLCSFATVLVLTGGDLGIVAALRAMEHQGYLSWVLPVWGGGSVIGGLVYGALHRHPNPFVLLTALGLSQILAGFARDPYTFAALLFVSGLFCAPALTSVTERLTDLAPARVRGEVMGWQGSALTTGDALSAPMTGVFIDRAGWSAGIMATGGVGAVIGLIGTLRRLPGRSKPADL